MRVRWSVFAPVFLLLLICLFSSQFDEDAFLSRVEMLNDSILTHFDWLFNGATVFFLVCLVVVYVSPLGSSRIGGSTSERLLTPWKYFSISICTTIAAGILFWSCSEPLFHTYDPPAFASVEPGSAAAQVFAMSTLFLHWAFTPYGIYTVVSVAFALCYYNLGTPFSVASILTPLLRRQAPRGIVALVDIICLFSLILGMAAALGAGILTMSGGIESVFGVAQGGVLTGVIAIAIVSTFVISSVSGLHKGIRMLSGLNMQFFLVLLVFCGWFAISWGAWQLGGDGLIRYLTTFVPASIGHFGAADQTWTSDWTVFYWAVWMAWAPCSALFLGRISKGYTVRQIIHYNLIFPSIFIIIWMIVFGAGTLSLDQLNEGAFYQVLQEGGPQSVIYHYFDAMPASELISVIFLLIVFITFVTAADSNTSVMGSLSMVESNLENPEAPAWIKVLWGTLIGASSWFMITTSGVDGIRLLSTIGGFPVLFILLLISFSLVKMTYSSFVKK